MEARNKRKPAPIPEGWRLLAIGYGTGKDDYLGIVLCFNGQEYVTWMANFDKGCEGVANGNYFNPRAIDKSFSDDERWRLTAEAAWNDFTVRAKSLVIKSERWERYGVPLDGVAGV